MVAGAICMLAGAPAFASQTTPAFLTWASIAVFGHGVWATNVISIPADIAPRANVGTVYGVTAFCGAMSALVFTQLVGFLVDTQHSYETAFALSAALPIVAAVVLLAIPGEVRPLAAQNG